MELFEDEWASQDHFWTNIDRVRTKGLRGWGSPADRLLAWVSVRAVLGVVPWDSAPGGRVQHIVKRTPRRDKATVLDFPSQFAPMEFILGEPGSQFPQSEVRAPLVFLARFSDNVSIFLINMTDAVATVQPVSFLSRCGLFFLSRLSGRCMGPLCSGVRHVYALQGTFGFFGRGWCST